MIRGKSVLGSLLMMLGMLALAGTVVQAQSGSLEPPGTAVNGSGDPVATTQTQPSWDQVLPASERFVLVMGGEAVLDKETGLVWEQSPLTTTHNWSAARFQCPGRTVGGKKGWRLPSVHALASLVDPGILVGGNLNLPAGHPFSNVQLGRYWSASTVVGEPTLAWYVDFEGGGVDTLDKITNFDVVWCVRGGGPLSEY